MSWHNIERAEKVSKAVFGSDICLDQQHRDRIHAATKTRHDIVHRNGITKEKKQVIIDDQNLESLSRDVNRLVQKVHDLHMKFLSARKNAEGNNTT
ncbi:hypothetical protein D3C87_1873330 [compost metagenome]